MFIRHNHFTSPIRWMGISIGIGLCVWLGTLWFQAAQLRHMATGTRAVRIATLTVMHIDKVRSDGGIRASFSFTSSFGLYWLFWVGCGALIGVLLHGRGEPPTPLD